MRVIQRSGMQGNSFEQISILLANNTTIDWDISNAIFLGRGVELRSNMFETLLHESMLIFVDNEHEHRSSCRRMLSYIYHSIKYNK